MRIKQYFLIFLIVFPGVFLIYNQPSETIRVIPNEPQFLKIQGDGQILQISTSNDISFNLSTIRFEDQSLITSTVLSAGDVYEYKFSQPVEFYIELSGDLLAEVTITISGIPIFVWIVLGLLLLINLINYRKEIAGVF